MTYQVYPAPTLGPARCKGCGQRVYWAKRQTRYPGGEFYRFAWRDVDGRIHGCATMTSATGRRRRPQVLRPGPSHS